MKPSSIRTLAFVALSVLVLTASCGTLFSMAPGVDDLERAVSFE